ncbi:MAG: Rpn family recombination-promoting nuclease/putative transposase [Puniceicoccales bacterium]|jgi:hypothetical protein|nr:Rpn family recombination-promoting nuclease/putative transposase [Puniceicoccales bacterium]
MPSYLDPKNDYAFKRVFGEHKNLYLSLLNSLLPIPPDEPIVELEYLSNELLPENPLKKFSAVDVRCTDKSQRQFLVEMQWHWTVDFEMRVLFNTAKVFSGQLPKGGSYTPKAIYALNFLNGVFQKDIPDYYHHYKIAHSKYTEKQKILKTAVGGEVLREDVVAAALDGFVKAHLLVRRTKPTSADDITASARRPDSTAVFRIESMEFVFVELPKFVPANRAERKLRDIWLQFLSEIELGTEVVSDDILSNPEVREALQYLEAGALTPVERAAYDRETNRIWSEIDAMDTAEEIGRAKGKAEERAIADIELAEERAKAELALAEERAKAEAALNQEKLAIVRNLLAAGMEPALIAQATKLPLAEIQDISKTPSEQKP